MAVLPIRMYPDPVLREAAGAVDEVDDAVRKLVRDMEETMHAARGVGLAAPQVGVQRRVLVFVQGHEDADEDEDEEVEIEPVVRALINPELSEATGEQVGEEGCLSIPGLAFDVLRADHIRVRALDADGVRVDFVATGFDARVIQHEVDHLDGVLFIDRVDRASRKEALRIIRERTLGSEQARPSAGSARM